MIRKATLKSSSATARSTKPAAAKPVETKKDSMLALLRRDGGATLDEVGKLTGWQPHSTRAMFTGLRKKGFALERTRTDGATSYAITTEPTA